MSIPIYKNTDTKIIATLKDRNGVVVNLNTLSGFAVWLSYQSGTVFLKYSYNMTAVDGINLSALGFKKMKVVNAVQGKFSFVIEAPDTANATIGVINLDYKIQYTDADVASGIFHRAGNPITYFGEITENVMQTQTNI
jgi:hypothetical protein